MTERPTAARAAATFEARVLPAAILLVTDDDGRVLLVKQAAGPYRGHWMVPGGGIEPGERARDAAVREFTEETGLEPREVRYLATYEGRGTWEAGPFHVLLIAYVGCASGEPHGEDEARWLRGDELVAPHGALLQVLVDAGIATADVDAALRSVGVTMERIDR